MTAMGYHLSTAVGTLGMTGRLAGLSPAAISCLLVMAQSALDRPTKHEQARVYFGGWERLGRIALGRDPYDAAAHRAVARAVSELIGAGLVKPVGRQRGVRQGAVRYELLLDGWA